MGWRKTNQTNVKLTLDVVMLCYVLSWVLADGMRWDEREMLRDVMLQWNVAMAMGWLDRSELKLDELNWLLPLHCITLPWDWF